MRILSRMARVVPVAIAVVLIPWSVSSSAVNWAQYWSRVAESDIVAVGALSNVSSSSLDGYLRFQGDLELESVAFGNVAPGDTLRMHWERPDPRGPYSSKTMLSAMEPKHEEYAAIGDVFPGVRVLWFLNSRDGGGVTAETSQSLISLSSDSSLKYAIEQLTEDPGPAETQTRVRNVLELLEEEYARHPAVVWRASQRSN